MTRLQGLDTAGAQALVDTHTDHCQRSPHTGLRVVVRSCVGMVGSSVRRIRCGHGA